MIGRILTWAVLGIVRGVLFGLGLLVRVVLALLGRAGLRGGRLLALAATVLLVYGWAAPIVGLRPAGWLAVIGWTAWLARHQPAQLDHSAAMRRLTAQVERHTRALANSTARQLHVPPVRQTPPARSPARLAAPASHRAASRPSSELDPVLPRWLGGGRWGRSAQ